MRVPALTHRRVRGLCRHLVDCSVVKLKCNGLGVFDPVMQERFLEPARLKLFARWKCSEVCRNAAGESFDSCWSLSM